MAAPSDGKRLHQLTRRWVVGAVAAAGVLMAATLIVAAPTKPRVSPAAPTEGILAATRNWTLLAELHGDAAGPSGVTGTAVPLQLGAVACSAGRGTCVAVGGPYVASRPFGGTWTVRQAPTPVGFLTSVSCAGPVVCVAVAQPAGAPAGDLAMSSSDGGVSWTPRPVPAGVEGLSGVACAGAARCTAVGEGRHGPVVVTTADGGLSWRLAPVPAGLGGLDAVGCAAGPILACIAVGWFVGSGGAAIVLLPAGVVERAPAETRALDSVACATATTCLVGGFLEPVPAAAGARSARFPGEVARSTDGGRHWTLLRLPSLAGPVNAVACVGPTDCVAAGVSAMPAASPAGAAVGPPGMALSTSDGGGSWQVDQLPAAASGLAGVTCLAPASGAGLPSCLASAAGPQSSSLLLAGA